MPANGNRGPWSARDATWHFVYDARKVSQLDVTLATNRSALSSVDFNAGNPIGKTAKEAAIQGRRGAASAMPGQRVVASSALRSISHHRHSRGGVSDVSLVRVAVNATRQGVEQSEAQSRRVRHIQALLESAVTSLDWIVPRRNVVVVVSDDPVAAAGSPLAVVPIDAPLESPKQAAAWLSANPVATGLPAATNPVLVGFEPQLMSDTLTAWVSSDGVSRAECASLLVVQRSDAALDAHGDPRLELVETAATATLATFERLAASKPWLLPHRDVFGRTVIHAAVDRGDPEFLRGLLRFQAISVGARDSQGRTALFTAVSSGCLASAGLLLNHLRRGHEGEDVQRVVNTADVRGVTPLTVAVRRLVRARTREHVCAAVRSMWGDMVALLLQAGASPLGCSDLGVLIRALESDGDPTEEETPLAWTAAHEAVVSGNASKLEKALVSDPELIMTPSACGELPIHVALRTAHRPLVAALLSAHDMLHGTAVNRQHGLRAVTQSGATCAHLCLRSRRSARETLPLLVAARDVGASKVFVTDDASGVMALELAFCPTLRLSDNDIIGLVRLHSGGVLASPAPSAGNTFSAPFAKCPHRRSRKCGTAKTAVKACAPVSIAHRCFQLAAAHGRPAVVQWLLQYCLATIDTGVCIKLLMRSGHTVPHFRVALCIVNSKASPPNSEGLVDSMLRNVIDRASSSAAALEGLTAAANEAPDLIGRRLCELTMSERSAVDHVVEGGAAAVKVPRPPAEGRRSSGRYSRANSPDAPAEAVEQIPVPPAMPPLWRYLMREHRADPSSCLHAVKLLRKAASPRGEVTLTAEVAQNAAALLACTVLAPVGSFGAAQPSLEALDSVADFAMECSRHVRRGSVAACWTPSIIDDLVGEQGLRRGGLHVAAGPLLEEIDEALEAAFFMQSLPASIAPALVTWAASRGCLNFARAALRQCSNAVGVRSAALCAMEHRAWCKAVSGLSKLWSTAIISAALASRSPPEPAVVDIITVQYAGLDEKSRSENKWTRFASCVSVSRYFERAARRGRGCVAACRHLVAWAIDEELPHIDVPSRQEFHTLCKHAALFVVSSRDADSCRKLGNTPAAFRAAMAYSAMAADSTLGFKKHLGTSQELDVFVSEHGRDVFEAACALRAKSCLGAAIDQTSRAELSCRDWSRCVELCAMAGWEWGLRRIALAKGGGGDGLFRAAGPVTIEALDATSPSSTPVADMLRPSPCGSPCAAPLILSPCAAAGEKPRLFGGLTERARTTDVGRLLAVALSPTVVHCSVLGLGHHLASVLPLWANCANDSTVLRCFVAVAPFFSKADVVAQWTSLRQISAVKQGRSLPPSPRGFSLEATLGPAEALDAALLRVTCGSGNGTAIQMLLRAGARPNGVVPFDTLCRCSTAVFGHDCVPCHDPTGGILGKTSTPIHAAVLLGRHGELRLLTRQRGVLSCGAGPNGGGYTSVSPLDLSRQLGRRECTQELLEALDRDRPS